MQPAATKICLNYKSDHVPRLLIILQRPLAASVINPTPLWPSAQSTPNPAPVYVSGNHPKACPSCPLNLLPPPHFFQFPERACFMLCVSAHTVSAVGMPFLLFFTQLTLVTFRTQVPPPSGSLPPHRQPYRPPSEQVIVHLCISSATSPKPPGAAGAGWPLGHQSYFPPLDLTLLVYSFGIC